jgi:pantothenate synthetase
LTYITSLFILDEPAIPSRKAKNRVSLLPREKRPLKDGHNKMAEDLAKQKGSITVVCIFICLPSSINLH